MVQRHPDTIPLMAECLSLVVALVAAAWVSAEPPSVLMAQPWGKDFEVRVNEAGDTISIGAVCSDGAYVWIYDMALGRVVRIDSVGRKVGTVRLESVGRATYVGDDFVVRGNQLLFLNTVDRRIEIFDASTGRHQGSVAYTPDVFPEEPKRFYWIINRIFLDSGAVLLGNERRAWYLDESLGKRRSDRPVISTGRGERLIGVNQGRAILVAEAPTRVGVLKYRNAAVRTHFPIAGKRFVVVNGRLYVLILESTGFRITAAL